MTDAPSPPTHDTFTPGDGTSLRFKLAIHARLDHGGYIYTYQSERFPKLVVSHIKKKRADKFETVAASYGATDVPNKPNGAVDLLAIAKLINVDKNNGGESYS